MIEQDIDLVQIALKDAILHRGKVSGKDNQILIEEYEKILRDLSKVTWELQIWKDGELYSARSSEDPNEILEWAANYRDWGYPAGLSPVDAFRHVQEEYNAMDISFTLVKKWRGDILVFASEHAENILLNAAEKKEALNV